MLENFDKILNKRRALKVFDKNSAVPKAVIDKGLEQAILAPSSFNLQQWEFYRIETDEMKKKMHSLCLSQASARTAGAFIVVVARPDLVVERCPEMLQMMVDSNELNERELAYSKFMLTNIIPKIHKKFSACLYNLISIIKNKFKIAMVAGDISRRYVEAHTSCGMAANNFMLSMISQGFATCPMMGVDEPRIKNLLKLPSTAQINMVIAIGKQDKDVKNKIRNRLPLSIVSTSL